VSEGGGAADRTNSNAPVEPEARGTIESQWKTLPGITPDWMGLGSYNFGGKIAYIGGSLHNTKVGCWGSTQQRFKGQNFVKNATVND